MRGFQINTFCRVEADGIIERLGDDQYAGWRFSLHSGCAENKRKAENSAEPPAAVGNDGYGKTPSNVWFLKLQCARARAFGESFEFGIEIDLNDTVEDGGR